ncbi:MAG TPA: choice-of-anchor A family protein, partial [Polyangiaceae bacterium]|nr:choice-of-anchor A family protein [Polyangiaceae bacterium]
MPWRNLRHRSRRRVIAYSLLGRDPPTRKEQIARHAICLPSGVMTFASGFTRLALLASAGLALLSCSGPEADSAPTGKSADALTSSCTAQTIGVADIHADFRDIWAGRETSATGKQAEPNEPVTLDFNTTVDPTRVAAQFTPVATDGSCGGTIAATGNGSVVAADAWGHTNSDSARPTTPAPYSVFAHETVTGIVSAAGAIAAGQDITLSSFSVNNTVAQPIGLIAGGKVTLTSGSVQGSLTYGTASTFPQTVTIGGTKTQQAFNVDTAFLNLESVSMLLNELATTGTTQVSGGTLTLAGTKTGLNVFSVSADVLAAASSLVINVPAGAGAIVNVSGPSVAILNKGITLRGATAQNLLFNFPGASFLHIAGVGFSGSLLAPDARVTFDSGSITGTVVTRSFQSSGSGALLLAPLNATLLLGSATPSAVLLKPAQPLLRGCTYTFTIAANTPLTAGGNCLASPLNVTFTVAPHAITAANRELEQENGDPLTHTLRRFVAKSGINTLTGDVWSRYESEIGVAHSSLVAVGKANPSVLHAGKTTQFYQQYQLGYPVFGHGFLAENEGGGVFRQALGRVTNALPTTLPTPVSSSAALQAALQYLHVTTPPWVSNPSVNKPPVLTLGLLPLRPTPSASDFKLVWDVQFANSGIAEPRSLQLDASSGSVIRRTKAARSVTYLDPKTAVFTPPIQPESFNYVYDNATHSVDVASYTLSSSGGIAILGSTLANDNGASAGVLETFFATQADFSDAKPIIDSTPATPWSAPNENSMAAAQWGVERADKFLKTLGFVSTPGNPPWTSVDGLHHQKVVVRWLGGTGKQDAQMRPGDAAGQNPADFGFIDLTDGTPGPPIERDTLPHEFDHLFQFNLRVAATLPDPENIGETGSVQEGLADLFGIGSVHQQFGEIENWQCVSIGTNCDRDLADPLSHGYTPNNAHPDFYEGPAYGNYLSTTNCPDDDDCFVHLNSTVISHWGYLLARGSGDAAPNTCGLVIDPLDLNTDTAFRYVIDISHVAYGGLIGFPTPAEPSFSDFRDATLVTARDMVDAGTVPPDTVQKFELAWYAVGLGPEYQTKRSPLLPTSQEVVPGEEATSVYPWQTFEWQTNVDGQTATSWDFQIADGPFDTNVKYEADQISETVVDNGVTKYVARVALPFNSTTRYFWRVRPTPQSPPPPGTPWGQSCYPVHTFVGTTTPDVIAGSEGGDLPPGVNAFVFSPVTGAVKYEVYVSAQDSNCQAGTGVQQFESATNSAILTGIQPQQHYWVEVQPIGPNDFTKQPSVGTCYKAQYDSAALQSPMPTYPLDTQIFDYHGVKNHPIFGWSAFNQPDHYLIQLFLRDQNGTCATTP